MDLPRKIHCLLPVARICDPSTQMNSKRKGAPSNQWQEGDNSQQILQPNSDCDCDDDDEGDADSHCDSGPVRTFVVGLSVSPLDF